MFALFAFGDLPEISVVATPEAFQKELSQRCAAARKRFESQAKERHEDLDMSLTSQIEALYRPLLGPWESEGAGWWHNMDFYGDGVRSLSFDWTQFPPDTLSQLRSYLGGQHVGFSVCINFYEGEMDNRLGRLWMDSREIIVTKKVAEKFARAA